MFKCLKSPWKKDGSSLTFFYSIKFFSLIGCLRIWFETFWYLTVSEKLFCFFSYGKVFWEFDSMFNEFFRIWLHLFIQFSELDMSVQKFDVLSKVWELNFFNEGKEHVSKLDILANLKFSSTISKSSLLLLKSDFEFKIDIRSSI